MHTFAPRINAVTQHCPCHSAIRCCPYVITVKQVSTWRGIVRPKRFTGRIAQGRNHLTDFRSCFNNFPVGFIKVIAIFGLVFQIFMQIGKSCKIALQGLHQFFCKFRTVNQPVFDRNQRIGNHAQAVNQATAAGVGYSGGIYIAHVFAGAQTFHECRCKWYCQQ